MQPAAAVWGPVKRPSVRKDVTTRERLPPSSHLCPTIPPFQRAAVRQHCTHFHYSLFCAHMKAPGETCRHKPKKKTAWNSSSDIQQTLFLPAVSAQPDQSGMWMQPRLNRISSDSWAHWKRVSKSQMTDFNTLTCPVFLKRAETSRAFDEHVGDGTCWNGHICISMDSPLW